MLLRIIVGPHAPQDNSITVLKYVSHHSLQARHNNNKKTVYDRGGEGLGRAMKSYMDTDMDSADMSQFRSLS